MSSRYEVSDVQFTTASPAEAESGLLGFVAFRLGPGLLVDGATVRRSLSGGLGLSYPARTDRTGRRRYSLRPVDDVTREDLEAQVLDALRVQGVLGPPGAPPGAEHALRSGTCAQLPASPMERTRRDPGRSTGTSQTARRSGSSSHDDQGGRP